MLKQLGIVILNYKNYKLTIEATKNLLKLSEELKIIIVDNNSPNESIKILEEVFQKNEQVIILKSNENGGYSKGNNIGIKYLYEREEIKYIAIMNPDVIIPNIITLKNCIEILNIEKKVGIVSPTMIVNEKINYATTGWKLTERYDDLLGALSLKLARRKRYKEFRIKNYQERIYYTKVEGVPGSFFMLNKELIKKIGYLDENVFLYCEEKILGKKIKNSQLETFLILSSFFYHNHIEGSGQEKIKIYEYAITSLKYYNETYNGYSGKITSKILSVYPLLHKIKNWKLLVKRYKK